jgi:hypothetical protein
MGSKCDEFLDYFLGAALRTGSRMSRDFKVSFPAKSLYSEMHRKLRVHLDRAKGNFILHLTNYGQKKVHE